MPKKECLGQKEILQKDFQKKIEEALKNIKDSMSVLYELATIDEKTGLYNHKFLTNMMEMEFEQAKRGIPLSLIAIDLDHFKRVNDTYGHLIGDEILIALAKIIKKELRKYDIPSRFGGEEFFILLPNTKAKIAIDVAKRLKEKIHKDKKLKKYKVTASFGITQYKQRDTQKKFINRADQALYRAKDLGRDTIVLKK